MFDLSAFVFSGLMDGIAQGQSRFVITERAAAWMARSVLSADQMQAISDALDERDNPMDEPTVIPEI